jgi:hypothetical protein
MWFFTAYFTFNKLLFRRAYNYFYKALSFTLVIKASEATGLIDYYTLSISLLNLFRFTYEESSSAQVSPKSFVELLLLGVFMLNCTTSLV